MTYLTPLRKRLFGCTLAVVFLQTTAASAANGDRGAWLVLPPEKNVSSGFRHGLRHSVHHFHQMLLNRAGRDRGVKSEEVARVLGPPGQLFLNEMVTGHHVKNGKKVTKERLVLSRGLQALVGLQFCEALSRIEERRQQAGAIEATGNGWSKLDPKEVDSLRGAFSAEAAKLTKYLQAGDSGGLRKLRQELWTRAAQMFITMGSMRDLVASEKAGPTLYAAAVAIPTLVGPEAEVWLERAVKLKGYGLSEPELVANRAKPLVVLGDRLAEEAPGVVQRAEGYLLDKFASDKETEGRDPGAFKKHPAFQSWVRQGAAHVVTALGHYSITQREPGVDVAYDLPSGVIKGAVRAELTLTEQPRFDRGVEKALALADWEQIAGAYNWRHISEYLAASQGDRY